MTKRRLPRTDHPVVSTIQHWEDETGATCSNCGFRAHLRHLGDESLCALCEGGEIPLKPRPPAAPQFQTCDEVPVVTADQRLVAWYDMDAHCERAARVLEDSARRRDTCRSL